MSLSGILDEVLAAPEPVLEPPPPPPPRGVAVDLDPLRRLAILVIGSRLALPEVAELRRHGAVVRQVPDLENGLEALGLGRWTAVAVDATIMKQNDGLRLVRALKCRPKEGWSLEVLGIVERTEGVPFVIRPLPGSDEIAVFWSARAWCLRRLGLSSLAAALLGL